MNFVLPPGLEAGTGVVTITTTDGQSASTEIEIAPLAPTLFILEPSGIPVGYAVQVGADNVQTIEPIYTDQGGQFQEVPIDVSSGVVYLILFGTGFDTPPLASVRKLATRISPPATRDRNRQFPGLDQINILLPKSLAGSGRGIVPLTFVVTAVDFYITIK